MIPECPKCQKGTVREYLGSRTSCLGWVERYDKNGNVISSDPNITISDYRCEECDTLYTVKVQSGKQIAISIIK